MSPTVDLVSPRPHRLAHSQPGGTGALEVLLAHAEDGCVNAGKRVMSKRGQK